MRKTFFTLFILGTLAITTYAQITTPAPSPGAKIEQKIGLSTLTVDYSRPSAKGRTVFGADALVSYGNLWRAGANAATKFTTSDDVTISGQVLKKGEYALLIKPSATSWQINFYPYESTNWSSYVEKTPVLTATAKTSTHALMTETFTIGFGDITSNSANLTFDWERTFVSLPLNVEVDKVVMANIEKVMAGPSSNDYYSAAAYYHDSGKDLEQALEWVKKANEGDSPKFWQLRKEALILADLGRYKEAIVAATKSKELASAAGNDEYVKMNDKSIADWVNK